MLQIVICDDEQKLRNALQNVVTKELQLRGIDYKITGFDCGESLITKLGETDFDIIFLDIEMKKLNGVETAKQIRLHNQRAVIIFVTSYPDYVFQGYEVKALNYVLKPYKEDKIIELLYAALKDLNTSIEQYYSIEQKSGVIKLPLSSVYYFYSDKRSVIAVSESSEISFYGKLNEVELELPDFFVRIHNRFLVNINHVTAVNALSTACAGEEIPVSRKYRQKLAVAFAKTMLR